MSSTAWKLIQNEKKDFVLWNIQNDWNLMTGSLQRIFLPFGHSQYIIIL